MGTATKIWLIAAASLVVAGLILFAVVMSAYQWNFAKLSTSKYETNTYAISEEFNNLSIDTDTADIVFLLSDNGQCKVECYEEENAKHSVTVADDTLVIKIVDHKAWYDYIGINFGSPKITVSLPKAEYDTLFIKEDTGDIALPKDFQFGSVDISLSTGDVDFLASVSGLVKIKTSTGAIRVEGTSAGVLELSTSTGRITVSDVNCEGDISSKVSTGKTILSNVTCKNLASKGDTGDISLKNVIAAEKFSVYRTTGDVFFDGCDAAEIFVETDTGKVTGSLLAAKLFLTETSTGKVNVPKSTTGGRCEIHTDTGNIQITVQ